MRATLGRLQEAVSGSYWFLPSAMAVGALVLALASAEVDKLVDHAPEETLGWFYGGDAESARDILSTIASAVITVVSLTFSVTVVTLTLAANQFGSRILYNFMRDRGNQFVLGTLIGTFIYSLLTLRMIEGDGAGDWVPHISVMIALVLTLLSVGVLIYFIHHVIEGVQANNVIAGVSSELSAMIERSYPPVRPDEPAASEAAGHEALLRVTARQPASVAAMREGVLQAIDTAALCRWARRHGVLVRLLYRPGEFVTRGCPAFAVFPAERVPQDAAEHCGAALLTGASRTLVQDVEFGFDQLTEIAVRALSPSLNDPSSATVALDRLGAALVRVLERDAPPAVIADEEGQPRVWLKVTEFDALLRRVFDPIRHYAGGEAQVLLHLLRVLGRLQASARRDVQRAALAQQALLARAAALEAAEHDVQRAEIEAAAEPFTSAG
jgi:uncharacterized membrane protein